MSEGLPTENGVDIVPRRKGLVVRPRTEQQLAGQLRYRHYEYPSDSNWKSYASQRHVRDIAFDSRRNQIWLATWGGVLCLSPAFGIRHTSEHGLIGNATRRIVVDDEGIVWAAGQEGGLCSLVPEENTPWKMHEEISLWTVLRMEANPAGGIYAALRSQDGQWALHEVTRKKARLPKPNGSNRALKEIEAMLVDRDKILWTANLWGLHRHQDNQSPKTMDVDRTLISDLATSTGGGLWLGTNRGLYRFRENAEPGLQQLWLQDEIVSLAEEPDTGVLWIVTPREVGRIVNNDWQPVTSSPERVNLLRIARKDPEGAPANPLFRAGQVWVGGASGLYSVEPAECKPVLTGHPEDVLTNSVQCLLATDTAVWMGTTRGLYSHSQKGWTNHRTGESQAGDIRTLEAHQKEGLWIGAWGEGLYRFKGDVGATAPSLAGPVISMFVGADGSCWAATIESIYYRAADERPWEEVLGLRQAKTDECIIQVICYQLPAHNGNQTPILWIGTSQGLIRYEPQNSSWQWTDALPKNTSVQSLALDPLANRLWVGSSEGLFSEHTWKCHRAADVRALAFSPPPESLLFIATADQVECLRSPENGDAFVTSRFSAREGGLAASTITALAVSVDDDQYRQLWVGSPAGVSSYRFSPQDLASAR